MRKQLMKDELQIGTEISMLVGSEQIQTFMEYENDEISDFRRAAIRYVESMPATTMNDSFKLTPSIPRTGAHNSLRLEEQKIIEEERDMVSTENTIAGLPEYVLGEPIPMSIPDTITYTCYYPGDAGNTKLSATGTLRSLAFPHQRNPRVTFETNTW